jgi:glycosyltransferase involved in cell wall biosynthesis
MKIAIFHNLPSGGGKRSLYEWTRRLAATHTMDVFSLNTADHNFCDIRPYATQHRIYDFSPRNLFRSPFGRLNQFQRWRDLGDLESLNRRIAEDINAGGYDVFFVHTCQYTFIPSVLRYVDVPSVYYLHEPFGPGFVRHFERPYLPTQNWRDTFNRVDPLIRLYQGRLAAIQERSVHKTTRLLANSKFTRDCMQAEYGVKPELSPLGVDLSDFRPDRNSQGEDFIVSVGEMSPRKGFDFIVKSLGTIPERERPKLELACNSVIQEELAYVKGLAQQTGVCLEVHVGLGVDELRGLYGRARLCVYAPVKEPFGLVPLEAMACGTPVVAVREGGVAESVIHGQTGLLTDRDPEQFGNAIRALISDRELAQLYGKNARDRVLDSWTWEKSTAVLSAQLIECSNLGA